MKVIVDKNTCIGCGACAAIAPDIFEMGDDTKAEAKKADVSGDEEAKAKDGSESCPVNAIKLE